MKEFSPQKKTAGNETTILSFNFILTKNPSNISIAKPPDEIIKMRLKNKPTSSPTAPKTCKAIATNPHFSRSNLLNSFLI